MRKGAWLTFLFLAACGPELTANRAVGKFDCGQSECGCSHPAAITLTGRTVDSSRAAIAGINVLCDGEAEPIGASDASGSFRAELMAQQTPGCGLSRCEVVRFIDPSGRFKDALRSNTELGGDVTLQKR